MASAEVASRAMSRAALPSQGDDPLEPPDGPEMAAHLWSTGYSVSTELKPVSTSSRTEGWRR